MLKKLAFDFSILVTCAALTMACSSTSAPAHVTDGGLFDAPDTSPPDGTTDGSLTDVRDGGNVDADANQDAPTDAPADGGETNPPSLCNPTFLFCDGFENGLKTWSNISSFGGTPTVDSTHVYRGSYALHAHIDAVVEAGVSTYAYVQQFQTWPTHVFTRVFVYQPSPHAANPSALFDMLEYASPYSGIELLTRPPSGGLGMDTYNTDANVAWQSEAGAIALGQWVCFELEVDTVAETSHLYMNDTEVTDLAQTGLNLPVLGIVSVGMSYLSPTVQPAEDVWIDEVAVNNAYIGCSM